MKVNSGERGIPLRTSSLRLNIVDTGTKGQNLTGLQKFGDKGRRKQRRSNHIAKDLMTPKYRQRTIERKRIENEKGDLYFGDRYYNDEGDD